MTAARAVLVGLALVASTIVISGPAAAAESPVRPVAHAAVVGIAAAPAASERLPDRAASERTGHDAVATAHGDHAAIRSRIVPADRRGDSAPSAAVHTVGARAPPAEGSA